MSSKNPHKGTTLIELVIVILIISILSTGGIEMVRLGFLSYMTGQNIINADWQGRAALERMTRDLHSIRSPSDITTATPTLLTFTDISGNTVTYQVTGTQLMRNAQVLADYVQSLAFNYYNSNGTTPISNSDIRYITITLNINNNTNFNFTTGVTLWNLT